MISFRRLSGVGAAALLILLAAASGGAGVGSGPRPGLDRFAYSAHRFAASERVLSDRAVSELATSGWHGGPTAASTGEQLTVYVSDAYAPEQASQQTWADFFAGLLHGSELPLLTAYVVTPAEVQSLCGLTLSDATARTCS